MFIQCIRLENAWGISKELRMPNISSFNILIGKNNVGKSSILKSLRWIKRNSKNITNIMIDTDIAHIYPNDYNVQSPSIEIEFELSSEEHSNILKTYELTSYSEKLLKAINDYVTSNFTIHLQQHNSKKQPQYELNIEYKHDNGFLLAKYDTPNETKNDLFREDFVGNFNEARKQITDVLIKKIDSKIQVIDAWRSLKNNDNMIINCLKKWRDPPNTIESRLLVTKWKHFDKLFKELTKINDIEVRFQDDKKDGLSLLSENRLLSIENYGDGIQHMLMLAYFLVSDPNAILLIEEPETHLHPELQRNLMHIIKRESKGQIFIATHSPILIDTISDCNIYRVERNPHQTITKCTNPESLRRILDVLDVRPSDILQANSVIWVEGPTDRMFLIRCFEILNTPLIEGVHYQFAYYGGRVRSHFGFDQMEEQDRIDVLKLCRHAIMLCDSDRDNETAPIDSTKERLKTECQNTGGIYWITAGREIENYFSDKLITRTVQRLTKIPDIQIALPQYEKLSTVLEAAIPETIKDYGLRKYDQNKSKLMRYFLQDMTSEDLDKYDLKDRLTKIINKIKEWSGLLPQN